MTKEKSHYYGHRRRLRERFQRTGFSGFSEHEIVELLLTLAIPRSDVKRPAKDLLNRFGNLRGILDAEIEELQETEGIGSVTPIALKIVREAAAIYLGQGAEQQNLLIDQEKIIDFWRLRIGALSYEVFEVAFLDSGFHLLRNGVETHEEGVTDRATIYPRRVVEAAIRRRASVLIFAHNHPNGNVQPTEQDRLLTRSLILAAETVHIKVHDHLIVSPDEVFSFREAGLL